MTTSPDTGSSRPGRLAGFALLGLAAVALVMGLVTVFGGNGDGNADGNDNERPPRPPASTSRTTTSEPTGRPPSSASSSASAPPSAPTEPTTTTPPGGDGNGEPAKTVPVRVLNNSKVRGLATDAADDFKAQGWQVAEVGNYSATNVPTTTAYFRPGTDEEAAARALAAAYGLEVGPRLETIRNLPAGVIVIVTGEYGTAAGGDGNKDDG